MTFTASDFPLTETITPAQQADVADAVRSAAAKGAAVYPLGGGTMLDYGVKPNRPGIGLSLSQAQPRRRLPGGRPDDHRRGRHHHRRIEQVLGAARGNGCRSMCRSPTGRPSAARWPSMRPARGDTATARCATTCWASRPSTARARRFLGGGRVVKNAAGYNMCRLMAGSLGTLGVITQVDAHGPAALRGLGVDGLRR